MAFVKVKTKEKKKRPRKYYLCFLAWTWRKKKKRRRNYLKKSGNIRMNLNFLRNLLTLLNISLNTNTLLNRPGKTKIHALKVVKIITVAPTMNFSFTMNLSLFQAENRKSGGASS